MNSEKLNKHIDVLKESLGEGLIHCDIWVSGTGQAIASYNGGNAKATALFDQITDSIRKALNIAEFPEIDPYYTLYLEDGTLLLILQYDKYLLSIATNPGKAPLGLVLNIAVPNVLESFENNH